MCDDHEVLRHGLRTVLARTPDLVVVAEAAGADEALALAGRLLPDVTLVGLGARGPVVQRLVGALTALGIRVVLLGEAGPGGGDFVDALRAGARGYMYTTVSPERLVEGVRAVANGETVLDGAVTGELLHRLEGAAPVSGPALPGASPLTARQWAVAELVAEGLTNAEIGERLRLSRATVKGHITVALRRLGLRDRTQLAIHVHRMTQGDDLGGESLGTHGQ
ncbi:MULTISPECIES: LuxR C-terminal-related transcriptional regulator [unclassified Blastococcus]